MDFRIELVCSILLPLIVWSLGTSRVLGSIIALILALSMAFYLQATPGSVFYFMHMFVVGVIIAKRAVDEGNARPGNALVSLSLALILGVGIFLPLSHTLLADEVVLLGTAGLIWAISTGRTSPVLAIMDSRIIRFLGKISYSFYLIHFVVFHALAGLAMRYVSEAILLRAPLAVVLMVGCISILITIPISVFSFRFVERPLTQAGRYLTLNRGTKV